MCIIKISERLKSKKPRALVLKAVGEKLLNIKKNFSIILKSVNTYKNTKKNICNFLIRSTNCTYYNIQVFNTNWKNMVHISV